MNDLLVKHTLHHTHLLIHHPLSSEGLLVTGRSRVFLAKGLWSLLVK